MIWVKVIHLLGAFSWMAGLFYLPRIFVHYAEGRQKKEDVRRLLIMARKLYRFTTMTGVLAIVPGLILWLYYDLSGLWLHFKLVFVLILVAYHFTCGKFLRDIQNNQVKAHTFYRIFNEVAVLLLIPILILVEVKPF